MNKMLNKKIKNNNDVDDTIHMLLTFLINKHLTIPERAKRIRKCAKYICARTTIKSVKTSMRSIRNHKNDQVVVDTLARVEQNWWNMQKNN